MFLKIKCQKVQKLIHTSVINFEKGAKTIPKRKNVLETTGAGTYAYPNKDRGGTPLWVCREMSSRLMKDLNGRSKVIQEFKRNRMESLHDLGFDDEYLEIIPKA